MSRLDGLNLISKAVQQGQDVTRALGDERLEDAELYASRMLVTIQAARSEMEREEAGE